MKGREAERRDVEKMREIYVGERGDREEQKRKKRTEEK